MTEAAAKPRKPRTRRTAESQSAEPAVEVIEEPAAEPVRVVNGLKVTADDPVLSHLPTQAGAPPITFRGMRLLTLEDQSQVHACVDCEYTGTRGDVQVHRSQWHGAGPVGRPGAARRRQEQQIPPEVLAMPLGELLHLGSGVHLWEGMFEQQVAETAAWKERALTAEAKNRSITRLLSKAGYEQVDA